MSTIPASHYVSVNPSVINAGGAALQLNGLFITNHNFRIPVGAVMSFPSAAAVTAYFGAGTYESTNAAIYFNGFDISTAKPAQLLMAYRPGANISGWLRGANVAALGLAGLQAITSATLTLTVGGTSITSGTINLSTATSFSNAATIIQAAFTSPPFTVTYDAVSGGFLFTTTVTGVAATISYGSGTLANSGELCLTQASGATISQGSGAVSANAFMNSIIQQNQNWISFMLLYDPDFGSGNNVKQQFAAWAAAQNNRYLYVVSDPDTTPATTNPATASLGYLLQQSASSGIAAQWEPALTTKSAFVCGALASYDFTKPNGRATLAYLTQSGLVPDVTDVTTAANLEANGYNYYGSVATANQGLQFFYPGQVFGPYAWIDTFACQVWLSNALQLSLIELLTQVKSVPYNAAGYALLRAACMGPINQAITFGAIQPGIALSASQIAEVNSAAGLPIDQTLYSKGFYLQILDPGATVRGQRGSPAMTLWYADGGSVQTINLASIDIQ